MIATKIVKGARVDAAIEVDVFLTQRPMKKSIILDPKK